jgi:hypothetical protein
MPPYSNRDLTVEINEFYDWITGSRTFRLDGIYFLEALDFGHLFICTIRLTGQSCGSKPLPRPRF